VLKRHSIVFITSVTK